MRPEDLDAMRATGRRIESSVQPPAFRHLVEGARIRRRRRRAALAGFLTLVLLASGSAVAVLGRGPDQAPDQARPPVSAPPTGPAVPDRGPTTDSARPVPTSTPSGPPASVRAQAIIASSTRLLTLKANPRGHLFEAFAGCTSSPACESAWRLLDPQRSEVARGILTGAANAVTPFDGGFVVTDLAGGFTVRNDGSVRQLGTLTPPKEPRAGDVTLPFGNEATIAYRPQDDQIYQVIVARQPARPAAWYTAEVDDRGWMWVLAGGPDGPTTTLYHSADHGRSWQAHDIGAGVPGELVISGDTIHVVTVGECAYECIVGGSTSVDHGQTWTEWPHIRNRYLYDLAAGAGDRLFLRTGDTTAGAKSPQVLVSSQPATGMVDLPGWHLANPSDDVGLLTSSGATLWFGKDASTLMRSDDNGTSWTELPAR